MRGFPSTLGRVAATIGLALPALAAPLGAQQSDSTLGARIHDSTVATIPAAATTSSP